MYIQLIANLPVLDFERRLENAPEGTTTFVSLYGTDFPILEPTEFDPKWFSHKFRGPGLRYEIGLCIRTGNIVWAHVGYPCGEWPDFRLARDALINHLGIGEKALADKGYRDNNYFLNPNGNQMKKILARHETYVLPQLSTKRLRWKKDWSGVAFRLVVFFLACTMPLMGL
ncbi:hypothetical protein GHT06_013474 [Daphnia sinensis]|uniref:DDE Tnp4 domain-containing protein n=1 Tax=Daphnia sinensis TaxID=1820382 RepID=A0AAD5LB69_9CRUS|nr:hypothetical protein GHT06_013474 [Daphnia sinensis]